MNRTVTTSRARAAAAPAAAEGAVRFSLGNWILLLGGLVAVLGGFALLATGSVVAAPLLLMLGYLVLIPWGIIR